MDDIWYLHMSGWPLLLHKPRCLQISPLLLQWTHLCMPSQESMPHSSLPIPQQILSLLSSFSPLILSSLHSMSYISSGSASYPPSLHCHIMYTSPLSSNLSISHLHLQLCCTRFASSVFFSSSFSSLPHI